MHKVIKKSDIPESGWRMKTYKRHPRTKQVQAFIQSGDEAWEIFTDDMLPHSVFSSFHYTINKDAFFKSKVYAVERQNRVFLVRID